MIKKKEAEDQRLISIAITNALPKIVKNLTGNT